jgi:hypothetical protein
MEVKKEEYLTPIIIPVNNLPLKLLNPVQNVILFCSFFLPHMDWGSIKYDNHQTIYQTVGLLIISA